MLIDDNLLDDVRRGSIDCCLDDIAVPVLSADVVAFKDVSFNQPTLKKAWRKGFEPRCDFLSKIHVSQQAGLLIFSRWRTSAKGRTLSEIKADGLEIAHFASEISAMLMKAFKCFSQEQWAVVCAPKRRHKQRNFASLVAAEIAAALGIAFYEDAFIAHSKQRVNAIFTLSIVPPQPNLIVFDDIVTSGSTLKAIFNALKALDKTLIFTVGIDNG